MTKEEITTLKERDLYSTLLYAIYKCTQDPEYAIISELIYSLDKKSLLNFCANFGGCTIKVPTLAELNLYANSLLIYKLMKDGKTFNEAYAETGMSTKYKKEVVKIYETISEILEDVR